MEAAQKVRRAGAVVNSDPVRMHESAETFARLAIRPLRVWRVSVAATPRGRSGAGQLCSRRRGVLEHLRLRGIGFRFSSSRSKSGCSRSPECSMSNERRRPVTAQHAIGESFDEVVLPHLAAARRLARWLLRNEHDAEDVVQESSLRAFRYFRTFTGGNGRAWFLRIVRNTCWSWRSDGFPTPTDPFDEEQHSRTHPGSESGNAVAAHR